MKSNNLFEIFFPDIDQMSQTDFESFDSQLCSDLNNLSISAPSSKIGFLDIFKKQKADDFLKLYSSNEKCFLETNLPGIHSSTFRTTEMDSITENIYGLESNFSNTIFRPDYLCFNGIYWRFINVYELPPKLPTAKLMDICDYFLTIRKMNKDRANSLLESNRKKHNANRGANDSNIVTDTVVNTNEELLEKIYHGEESLWGVQCWFIIKANSPERLDDLTQTLISLCSLNNILPYIEDVGIASCWESYRPNGVVSFFREHIVPTSYLSGLIPLKQESIHKNGSIFYSRRGIKVKLDIQDVKASSFNVILTGIPGAGKTALALKLIHDGVRNNKYVVHLDKGSSGYPLAKYHKANIIMDGFNPMTFNDPEYLKEFIIAAIPENEISHKTRGLITKEVTEIMEKDNPETFKKLIEKLETKIKDISLYFEELWPYFDDSEVALKKYTYIDITLFPEKVLPCLLIFVTRLFKSIKSEKILALDECETFLENNVSYIGRCFREFRKEGGSCIAISQLFSDFIKSKVGEVLAKTSYFKIFFRHECEVNEYLDKEDVDKINNLRSVKDEYSEFFLKTPENRKILRYYQDSEGGGKEEKVLFNTTFETRNKFLKFAEDVEEYMDFVEITQRYGNFFQDF